MTFRSKYWSCSKLANRIRGTVKPSSLTREEWKSWKDSAKKAHAIRYWIAEEGLEKLQDLVNFPIDVLHNIRYYVNNRWISKTHALTSNLKRGEWHEFETRLLHCMFDELVNFVEIEQAWMMVVFDELERKKYSVPWWRKNFLKIRKWRSPEAGLAYLEWAAGLTWNEDWVSKDSPDYGQSTPQAKTAQETIALYKWWKETRPARPDPYDASGWTEYCANKEAFEPESKEDEQLSRKLLDQLHKMEEDYHQEDTEMMIKLIQIRQGLWT